MFEGHVNFLKRQRQGTVCELVARFMPIISRLNF